jgi:hypothetical protein
MTQIKGYQRSTASPASLVFIFFSAMVQRLSRFRPGQSELNWLCMKNSWSLTWMIAAKLQPHHVWTSQSPKGIPTLPTPPSPILLPVQSSTGDPPNICTVSSPLGCRCTNWAFVNAHRYRFCLLHCCLCVHLIINSLLRPDRPNPQRPQHNSSELKSCTLTDSNNPRQWRGAYAARSMVQLRQLSTSTSAPHPALTSA